MRRWSLIVAAAGVVALSTLAADASASRYLQIGIGDDAQVLYGTPEQVFPLLASTGSRVIRVTLWWSGPAISVSKSRPKRAVNPADPSYDWATYDRTVTFAANNGMKVLFTIMGTPSWANAGQGWNAPPTKFSDLRLFAVAAATRYSGKFRGPDGRILPRVSNWTAWNEPNNPVFLKTQYVRSGTKWVIRSGKDYAGICNAVVQGVHSMNGGKVACGVTAPRGNNNPTTSRPSVSPLPFLRAMKKAGAKGFDAYAHHPYAGSATQTPTSKPPQGSRGQEPTAVTLGNLDVLEKELSRQYGNMRLWITEYAYQTNPPDPLFGVTWAKQAAYLKQAVAIARANRRIDMFLWFLVKDESSFGGWQSGLMTARGAKKPSFAAFIAAAR